MAQQRPPQEQQHQPGREQEMTPRPQSFAEAYVGTGKLKDQVVFITGADSGIGRAAAIALAKEGADIAVVYLEEHADAKETRAAIEAAGRRCLLIAGDVGDEAFCQRAVTQTVEAFGRLDVLINNAAEQHEQKDPAQISGEQLRRTFATNIFSMFYCVTAALPHLKEGSRIINTTSVTAYKGNPTLIDYASTKGAIVAFTRSLSENLIQRRIRVNAVAPGPIWTPLIPASFDAEKVAKFGEQVPMKRAGEPDEVAYSYVFLATDASSYMSGQVLHPNGGVIVNG
ncbi:MAG TPA: SDR family oxidoreductase [Burkholderiales bacterium]|jgi:NAD(P)-dependent dehydrogenase (short-subunit alcohol dehydrogenase family)|nr:SDR family oxidoreductase [Burkholderiales bacterium]